MSQLERQDLGLGSLPGMLSEALEELAKDEVVKQSLGTHVLNRYIEAKYHEWDDYRTKVHQWELDYYLPLF
jgi:glutamine synthetase